MVATLFHLPIPLASVWMLVYGVIGMAASSSAINLHVSHTNNAGAQAGPLVINCTLNAKLADMETLASLTVFGSKPYGDWDEFEQLAVVDIWSQQPRLSSKLEDANVVSKGETNQANPSQSYLFLSWDSPTSGYRQFYKCVANGMDSKGLAASSFATVNVERLDLGGGNCKDVDSIDSELRLLSDKLGNTSVVTGEILQYVQTFPANIKALENKLEEFQRSVDFEFKKLAIERAGFVLSSYFKERVYAISKQEESFNIAHANEHCKALGGYLLEIDDEEEYQFVYDFTERIGGSNTFWTGGNDIDKEGIFVYYNSKRPVPHLSVWSQGQPDDGRGAGSEDCMEISLKFKALNDWVCSQVGKYVCEVPFK